MRDKNTVFLNNNFSVQAEQAEKLLLNKKRREAAEDFAFEFEESLHTLHAHQPSGETKKWERDPNQFSKTKPKAKQPAPNLTSCLVGDCESKTRTNGEERTEMEGSGRERRGLERNG